MPENISIMNTVLGVTDPTDKNSAYAAAHLRLTGEAINPELHGYYGYPVDLLEEFGVELNSPADRTKAETLLDALTLRAIFGHEGLPEESSLVSWPCYEDLWGFDEEAADVFSDNDLGDHDRASPIVPGRTALLIGAATPLSVLSFNALAQDVYGAEKVQSIDILAGEHKARLPGFRRGSGLRLPYGNGTIDVVQTSHLYPKLEDNEWLRRQSSVPDNPAARKALLVRGLGQEISRVLRPGGRLVMVEHSPFYDPNELRPEVAAAEMRRGAELVRSHLGAAGLEQVEVMPVGDYLSASPNYDYLFDPERTYTSGGLDSAVSFGVSARKPED